MDPKYEQHPWQTHTQMVLLRRGLNRAMKVVHSEGCECVGVATNGSPCSKQPALLCGEFVDLLTTDPEQRVMVIGRQRRIRLDVLR